MNEYIKLGIVSCLPVIASAMIFILEKKTPLGKLNYWARQVAYGIIFGLLAVIGTEWGIPINGAQVNCRDAAVLAGGLMFGAPTGIIAGLIGGVERWVAVAWGVGTFTRVACSISTIVAGIYAALLRKLMFDNRRPGWLISFSVGIVMEVFHLTMVFLTNMNDPEKAMNVVAACTVPMVVANGVSVLLTAVVLSLLSKDSLKLNYKGARISQTIQRWMLIVVIAAFGLTTYFVVSLQQQIALSQADRLLTLAAGEVAEDIRDASDASLLKVAHEVEKKLETESLADVAKEMGISEIHLIGNDENGTIIESTNEDYLGFYMSSGVQSSEFLCLLEDQTEFVQDYGPISIDQSIKRKCAGIRTETGILQVAYDAVQFQANIGGQMKDITKNRHVGETGYLFIIDSEANVVSAPVGMSDKTLKENFFGADSLRKFESVSESMFRTEISGEGALLHFTDVEGYSIVSVLPEEEAFRERNIALYVNTFMEILVFALLFGFIYQLIRRVVVSKIKKINKSLGKITAGDLNEVVNVRSNEEFDSLSNDINSTVDTLKRYIAEASARIDKELEFAKSIQLSALPGIFPAFPKRKDLDIFARMEPAKEVGGDFYDFYLTGSDTLNFLIADVSGKGIPAAMFMMRAKTELKTLTESGVTLGEVFTRGNAALCEGNDAGMFVTAWQGQINLETGKVLFANAGHNPPVVKRANGSFEYLRSKVGFVLAGMDGVQYKQQEYQLYPGDTIYLYTDGVTEATNADNQLYGEERLLTALNSREFTDMRELCDFIKADTGEFVGEAPQFDDMTMLAFKYIGPKPCPEISFEKAKIEDISTVTAFVEENMERIGCPMKTVTQFNIAVDEIFSNIVKYAYPDAPGPIRVKIVEKDDPHAVFLRFEDEGIPYNPLTKEDPDVTLSADERSIGGLGIFMVKKSMDNMLYKYEDEKNVLTILKVLDK